MIFKTIILTAAIEYYRYKIKHDSPLGNYDAQGRWYPSEIEKADCCDSIRNPSKNWPYSMRDHCRTVKHIACRMGLVEKDIKKYYKLFFPIIDKHRKELNTFMNQYPEEFTEQQLNTFILETAL